MKYEAKYSVIGKAGWWTFLTIIFCWLIFPVILWLFYFVSICFQRVEFYKDKVIIKKGVIAKSQKQMALTGILSVSVNRTVMGSILNYGNVEINTVGRHCDLSLKGIKNPNKLKNYLDSLFVNSNDVKQFISE